MKILKFLLGIAILFAPFATFAHPGHGEHGGFTITHYFTEPEHVALLVLVISGIVFFALKRKKETGK